MTTAYKTKWFHKWAGKEGLTDSALQTAIQEIDEGLIDADLGGRVIKKRIGLQGRGKRGGARTLLAYRFEDKAFFVYGFAKNERDNISRKELKALQLLAAELLGYGENELAQAIAADELIEVMNGD